MTRFEKCTRRRRGAFGSAAAAVASSVSCAAYVSVPASPRITPPRVRNYKLMPPRRAFPSFVSRPICVHTLSPPPPSSPLVIAVRVINASISGANMRNAVVTEAYVSGATKMEPAIVEGAGERPKGCRGNRNRNRHRQKYSNPRALSLQELQTRLVL